MVIGSLARPGGAKRGHGGGGVDAKILFGRKLAPSDSILLIFSWKHVSQARAHPHDNFKLLHGSSQHLLQDLMAIRAGGDELHTSVFRLWAGHTQKAS